MRKNIFTTLILSSAIFVFSSASAQQTTDKQTAPTLSPGATTQTKEQKPITTTQQTQGLNQPELPAKEYGVKINEWMKANIGTNETQGVRITVASSNLISSLRDIRSNVTDVEVRKTQIQNAMQNFNAQLKSVLTVEQFENYKIKRQDLIRDYKEMKNETVNE